MQRCYTWLLLGFTAITFQSQCATAKPLKTDSAIKKRIDSQITTVKNLAKQTAEKLSVSNLFEQLNLTPQQTYQIDRIRRRYQAPITRLKEELRLAQQQLSTMMAGTDSATTIRAKHQQITEFRQELGELHFESMLATREILTPQQRQKFAEIIRNKQ